MGLGENTRRLDAFLKAVPHLKHMDNGLICKLSEVLLISPDSLALFNQIAANTGWFYEN